MRHVPDTLSAIDASSLRARRTDATNSMQQVRHAATMRAVATITVETFN